MDEKQGSLYNIESRDALRDGLKWVSYLALPLFIVFWGADWIYSPQNAWLFLALRLTVFPVSFALQFIAKRSDDVNLPVYFTLALGFWCNLIITSMIYITDGAGGVYYSGLNLVTVGFFSLLPWNNRFVVLAIALFNGPYFALCLAEIVRGVPWKPIVLNLFFVFSTIVISTVVRIITNRLRVESFIARNKLNEELRVREELVIAKSNEAAQKSMEAVNLKQLSRQFSKQVVHAIETGRMRLHDKAHRAEICALFIDIENSTERLRILDHANVMRVFDKFINDTMRILVKNDMTIDKFMGDGILAFSNDPIRQDDFVLRAVNSAVEIRSNIIQNQHLLADDWRADFKVHFGIAKGFASVGFFGDDEVFRTYTAIGVPLNLSQRICSYSLDNNIAVSLEVKKDLENYSNYTFSEIKLDGPLRGFENEKIRIFNLTTDNVISSLDESSDEQVDVPCSQCGTNLYVDSIVYAKTRKIKLICLTCGQ